MVYEGVSRVKGTTRNGSAPGDLTGGSLPLLGPKWRGRKEFPELSNELELKKKCGQLLPGLMGRGREVAREFRLQDLYLPRSKLMLLPPFSQR